MKKSKHSEEQIVTALKLRRSFQALRLQTTSLLDDHRIAVQCCRQIGRIPIRARHQYNEAGTVSALSFPEANHTGQGKETGGMPRNHVAE